MISKLLSIGFTAKESQVYLYLVEYGTSWASEIARHLNMPKSTINFIAENLWKRWYLIKSARVNTNYYEADISLLEWLVAEDRQKKDQFLAETIPELYEMNQNIRTKPKIVFFDGRENCAKAYRDILSTSWTFYEFWAHGDLVEAFGSDFMEQFIRERVAKDIFCDSIGTLWDIELDLREEDSRQLRSLRIHDPIHGTIGSSIAIYDDFVLVLNLKGTYSGVRIQNREFAQTMRTIFTLSKQNIL